MSRGLAGKKVRRDVKAQAHDEPNSAETARDLLLTSTRMSDIDSGTESPANQESKKKKTARHLAEEQPMSAARALPLLICSIGNPGTTYANTLHSAGHTIVQHLASQLNGTQFTKSRQHGNGLMTRVQSADGAAEWTLWQSTSYMNESGAGVKAAHREWSRHLDGEGGKLVIVHDELEKPLGAVSLKTNAGGSAKGHNGLKSIKALIGDVPYARLGIGIGRPMSRDSDDVSRYVLRKMTPAEKEAMKDCISDVVDRLDKFSKT